jgi:hypothetical protein
MLSCVLHAPLPSPFFDPNLKLCPKLMSKYSFFFLA